MSEKMIVAAIQMNPGSDKKDNLSKAENLIEEAVAREARYVVLPEFFNCLVSLEQIRTIAETADGETICWAQQLSAKHKIYLCAGSIAEIDLDDPDKVFNTSFLIAPDGEIVSKYRKKHLFDIHLADIQMEESKYVTPGNSISSVKTEMGRVGQAICYDLRFPELFRELSLSQTAICGLPAAFTKKTGADHWEILLRARAIENQMFLVAANQVGQYTETIECYGHSMIVDPWGAILAEADGEQETVVLAEIDLAEQQRIRRELPALSHRRDVN
ncbi:MAG: hydrolase [Blastopirellula sp.]|nr:MAG: hydrolase [Blastopirellula sp.]